MLKRNNSRCKFERGAISKITAWRDGTQKTTELNLMDLIFEGKKENNPYLFDGDIIKFKKQNLILLKE